MYRNIYYKKQVLEVIRKSNKFVWANDNLSGFRLKIPLVQFQRIFEKEK